MSIHLSSDLLGLTSFHEFLDPFLSENCWQARLANKLFFVSRQSPKICKSRCVAAVVKNRKIVAIGKNSLNSTKLSRRFKKNDYALYEHAEISAIKKGIRTGKHFDTIFVVRAIYKDGFWRLADAKPCPGCEGAIKHFNIRNVFYSSFCNYEKTPENFDEVF